MIALSIRQPWAWLIVNGHKDIENRDWHTSFRGPVLIHAGKTMARRYYIDVTEFLLSEKLVPRGYPSYDELARGGVVGAATITGCVHESQSPWFNGPHGFTIADAQSLPFHPCNGKLGFFDVPGFAP